MRKFLLVASIPVETSQDLLKLQLAPDVDLIELRVDYLENPLAVDYSRLPKNIIVTLRDPYEGGVRPHSDATKLALLDLLNKHNIMYDVEVRFIKRYNVDYRNKLVSIHIIEPEKVDLRAVREDVEKYIDKAFVVKVATRPFPGYRTFLAELLNLGDNVAVMPIGTDHLERIAFAFLGSKLLYCYIDKPTALGQPRCNDVKRLLTVISESTVR